MSESYKLPGGPLSSQELAAKINWDKADTAFYGLKRTYESLGFTAPEVLVLRYNEAVRYFNDLGAALLLFDKVKSYREALIAIAQIEGDPVELVQEMKRLADEALKATKVD